MSLRRHDPHTTRHWLMATLWLQAAGVFACLLGSGWGLALGVIFCGTPFLACMQLVMQRSRELAPHATQRNAGMPPLASPLAAQRPVLAALSSHFSGGCNGVGDSRQWFAMCWRLAMQSTVTGPRFAQTPTQPMLGADKRDAGNTITARDEVQLSSFTEQQHAEGDAEQWRHEREHREVGRQITPQQRTTPGTEERHHQPFNSTLATAQRSVDMRSAAEKRITAGRRSRRSTDRTGSTSRGFRQARARNTTSGRAPQARPYTKGIAIHARSRLSHDTPPATQSRYR